MPPHISREENSTNTLQAEPILGNRDLVACQPLMTQHGSSEPSVTPWTEQQLRGHIHFRMSIWWTRTVVVVDTGPIAPGGRVGRPRAPPRGMLDPWPVPPDGKHARHAAGCARQPWTHLATPDRHGVETCGTRAGFERNTLSTRRFSPPSFGLDRDL